jgi:uncharacterized protein YecT (DUF1311 family)
MLLALLLVATPQTQADLNRQAAKAYAAADAALNVAYRAALMKAREEDVVPEHDPHWRQSPGPTWQQALLAAQRAWLAYRDAECRIEGYRFRGGSAEGLEVAQCKASLTRARTVQLKALAR